MSLLAQNTASSLVTNETKALQMDADLCHDPLHCGVIDESGVFPITFRHRVAGLYLRAQLTEELSKCCPSEGFNESQP